MKEIKLTGKYDNERVVLVDDEDYERVSLFKWSLLKNKTVEYAKNSSIGLMHRMILKIDDKNQHVDHLDHNGLNNQKSNLRLCTVSENMRNRRKIISKPTSSKYIGVYWSNFYNDWKARYYYQKNRCFTGSFDTEVEAAVWRNEKIKKYGSEFDILNEITNDDQLYYNDIQYEKSLLKNKLLCGKCKRYLEFTEFTKCESRHNGLSYMCKYCQKEKRKKYYDRKKTIGVKFKGPEDSTELGWYK